MMDVQACAKPMIAMSDDSDEDDVPLVFKRSNMASKKNSNSEVKRPSSQNHDGKSGGQRSDVRFPNGQNASAQKVSTVSSSKSPPMRSPLASPEVSSYSSKPAVAKPSVANSKASVSAADKSKHTSQQNAPPAVKKEKSLTKAAVEPKDEDEDSADDKPLSSRLSAGVSKGSSDDDDVPIVFKRSNMASKQNSNSEVKRPSSQNHDGKSGGQRSDVRFPNGQNASAQKVSTVSSSKSPPMRSPLASPEVSSSSSKPAVAKPSVANSKASVSAADKSKHTSQQNAPPAVKEEKSLTKAAVEPKDEDEDSADDKPLSSRLSAGVSKGSSDEDDVPLVFKRCNMASKQNSNSEVKRPSSQNHDSKSGGQRSDVRFPNGQNASAQKVNTVSSSKSPPMRSPLASPEVSSSSSKPAVAKPSVANSKASVSAADKSKHTSQQNAPPAVKEEKSLTKAAVEPKDEDEDSADDKPLSSRLSAGVSKGSSDEDDVPLVFKRSNMASKQNSNSEVKRPSSQNHDGKSGGQRSDVRFPNGQNASAQKVSTVSSSKSPPMRSPLASPEVSSSSSKPAVAKPSVANSKASVSAADKSKHTSQQNAPPAIKEEKSLTKAAVEPKDEDEDSADDKPLSSRLSAGVSKGSSDEDDVPLVFKRCNMASKQNSNSEVKRPSSQNHDGKSGGQRSDVRFPNGQNASAQKVSTVYSSKSPPMRSPLASPEVSSSSSKPAVAKPSVANSKASVSAADKSKHTSQQNAPPAVKEEKSLTKAAVEPKDEDEDSADDKPLSSRLSAGVSKGSSDEDDVPLVFKRCNMASKQNSNSEVKRPSSQNHDGKSGGQRSDVRFPNGQNASAQKVSTVSSSKSPPMRSPLASPEVSSSSSKPAVAKPSVANSKASVSAADKSKHTSQQNAPPAVKEEKSLTKAAVEPKDEDEDYADDKPLSSRLSAGVSKGSSSRAQKVPNSPSPKLRIKDEDSDDEKPLSSKNQLKPNAGASTSKCYESDDNKPIALKFQQNGSTMRDNKAGKVSTGLNKRPSSEAKSSGQSSVKKPKLSDASTPTNSKSVPVKKEIKHEDDDDDENDHLPISHRMKKPSPSSSKSSVLKKVTKVVTSSFKKPNKNSKKVTKKSKYSKSSKLLPGSGDGKKWTSLEHNGVIFPPPYNPHGVKMLYKGNPVDLTPEQEEVATMYAVMLETDYMAKPKFKENFWSDWRKILGKNHVIRNLEDCNFTPIYEWHQREKEKKKQMTTEEKKVLKEEKMKQEEKYMWAVVDGVKEKVGNFRVEPPGLFRGRGEHPKMGKLKKRIRPSDITINIGKGAPVPECHIPSQSWKEVRHDNTVTWLAYWNDPINPKEFKYVFLAASSSLKGQSDKEKYEKARKLKGYIQGIRTAYTKDFGSKDDTKKQIAVATYLIDKLALRAGNEKDDDEADTVGCCTLKVENVEPKPPNILKFDFLGKDSIRYQNEVEVELPVYKAIQQFRTGKNGGDDLFDQLDTSKLNAHLKELMPGLTAKVFRTYNASITLDEMLSRETRGGDVAEKVVVYQHANKEVAIICNHQRSVSKSHSAQMLRLNEKIDELKAVLEELEIDLARAKKGKPPLKNADGKPKRNLNPEALERKISQTNAKIEKMERDKETKEDLKTVALGTSKINYLDPRITVAWCKRHEVPIEKIFNKSLLAKFAWSMDVDPSFRF